ncbi:hypothetical protein [Kitasatospora sp. NPDC018619]|uniref:hypothetical protein n=1 Tax=unclassified Kitasatospora TaxID=2633591 RepID=UPI0037BC1FE2
MRLRPALAAALATAVALLPAAPARATATAPHAAHGLHRVSGEVVRAPLSALVEALPVEDEGQRDGYSREQFKHWIDADHDGCNTRNEVLLRDAIVAPQVTGRCTIVAGTGVWGSW